MRLMEINVCMLINYGKMRILLCFFILFIAIIQCADYFNVKLVYPIAFAEAELGSKMLQASLTTSSYRILPGDILSIAVNEEPEFDQANVIVRRDGFVTIRPVGEIYVANQDIQVLTQLLESKFKNFVNNPKVLISIQQFHTPKIYLFGAVMRQGLYQPLKKSDSINNQNANDFSQVGIESSRLTLSNVLASAGGVAYNANLTNVQILKQSGKVQHINLIDFLFNKNISQDLMLEEGDIIQVPKLETFNCGDAEFLALSSAGLYPQQFPVRILGQVEKPGMFYISTDTPYLNSALALASGLKMNAVSQAILVTRRNTNNQLYKMAIDPKKHDLVLRPNDIIEVKDKHSAKAVRGLDAISRITQPLVWGLGMWATTLK